MKPLGAFGADARREVRGVFLDIDDTLTSEGRLTAAAYGALERLSKDYEIHVYEGAGHAFANPSGRNFNAEYADDAWNRTLDFLRDHLAPESR